MLFNKTLILCNFKKYLNNLVYDLLYLFPIYSLTLEKINI